MGHLDVINTLAVCNFMSFLNDKCGHGVGAEYMVDLQNN